MPRATDHTTRIGARRRSTGVALASLLSATLFAGTTNAGAIDDTTTTDPSGTDRPDTVVGFVWDDTDDDGRYDLGESSLSGVTLHLDRASGSDEPVETATTDNDGFYRFNVDQPGEYIVSVPAELWNDDGPLVGYRSSTGDSTARRSDNGIDIADTNDTTIPVSAAPVALSVSGPERSVDFGFHAPTYRIGGAVWDDVDDDSAQNDNDDDLEGVWIELHADANLDGEPDDLNEDGAIDATDLVASDTTDTRGRYVLDELDAGTYLVSVPAVLWADGGRLVGYRSSTGHATVGGNPDGADNGLDAQSPGERIVATSVTLDGTTSDDVQVQFGFVRQEDDPSSAVATAAPPQPSSTLGSSVPPSRSTSSANAAPSATEARDRSATPTTSEAPAISSATVGTTTPPVATGTVKPGPIDNTGAAAVASSSGLVQPPGQLPRTDGNDDPAAPNDDLAAPNDIAAPADFAAPVAFAEGATPFLILIAFGLMGLAAAAIAGRRQKATVPAERNESLDGQ